MANNPIRMSKIRHLLQLHYQGRSKLQIAAQTGISRNTLKKYLKAFSESKLTFHVASACSFSERALNS